MITAGPVVSMQFITTDHSEFPSDPSAASQGRDSFDSGSRLTGYAGNEYPQRSRKDAPYEMSHHSPRMIHCGCAAQVH